MRSKQEQYREDQRAFGDAIHETYQPSEEQADAERVSAAIISGRFAADAELVSIAQRRGYISAQVIA